MAGPPGAQGDRRRDRRAEGESGGDRERPASGVDGRDRHGACRRARCGGKRREADSHRRADRSSAGLPAISRSSTVWRHGLRRRPRRRRRTGKPREGTASDLNVIGCTVDEAIARAERFLDDLLLTDQRVVRLIHGYGTGQLKRALTGFLQQHPLVARFATAPPEQGGGGVTVVELKD
ncbi:MAG: hypothetical protein DMG04_30450 [Acidobacteria bacterium]|nr:MAG: hypothetical protein DMG04_30450 [Acidobacteriota bacterium]